MTGLDVDNDVIIEIACFITNGNLELVDEEGWEVVIHQSKETMDKMVRTSTPLPKRADLIKEIGRMVHQDARRERSNSQSPRIKNQPRAGLDPTPRIHKEVHTRSWARAVGG